jgi:Zn finger protein HypA/HybF involved in hydrogenase expression
MTVALVLALGATSRMEAQVSADVSSEFNVPRGQTIVEMAKKSLDQSTRLGAFYSYPGHVQQAPASELTLHIVRSAPTWAFAYDHTVMVILDDRTRLPFAEAKRATSVGEGYTLEQIFFAVSRDQASQIAQAHKVEMKVGSSAFVWSDSLQHAFREMVTSADAGAK